MQIGNGVNSSYYASYRSKAKAKYSSGFNQEDSFGAAVTVAKSTNEGEFLGITMMPEEGQAVVYGMRAMLSEQSTPTKPIVQVISNLGGQKEVYNVDISKVDPNNATQLEMFALLSYADKMGMTDAGTLGSYQQLKVYGENASLNGYCGSLSGGEVFLNETFDWSAIIERMMEDYLEAEIYDQYQSCKNLLNTFGKFAPAEKGEEDVEALVDDASYQKVLREKIDELLEKIRNGDTETTYQIGAQSFTEEEWEEFLEKFDSLEDLIKELMRERHAKQREDQEERELLEEAEIQ